MISINFSKTAHLAYWKSNTTSFVTNFFFNKKILFLDFFPGLNFVSDYMLQLYFVCNHLIYMVLYCRSPTLLKCYGITHVLNCAAEPNYENENLEEESPYSKNTGLEYCSFPGKDIHGYPILRHFPKAKEFIDAAKINGGKVLVHCEMGINRSAAICVAYILVDEKLTLLEVIKRVKRERRVILVNESFQRQLVEFAMEKNLLY